MEREEHSEEERRGEEAPRSAREQPSRGGPSARLWLLLLLIALLAVFVLQNSQRVTVEFLFAETETPLAWGLLTAVIAGAILGWLLGRLSQARRDRD